MDGVYKEFVDSLIESEKHWHSADHLVYVTFPVVKDERLLLKSLESLYKGVRVNISAILKFEYLYKRISLYKDPEKNLRVFFDRCLSYYDLKREDSGVLKELVFFGKKHKDSAFEFSKSGRFVIVDDSLGKFELTSEKMKEFLSISKKLLKNTNSKFRVIF